MSGYVVAEVVNRRCQQDAFIPRFLPESPCNFGRHFGLAVPHHQAKGYYHSKVNRHSNSDSTFQLIRLKTSGDISLNPGPSTARSKCQKCSRTIARNHRVLECNLCGLKYHVKCGNVTPKEYGYILKSDAKIWKCPWCLTQPALPVDDLLSALPFTSVSDESFLSIEEGQEGLNTDNAIHNGEDGESYLADLTQHLQSFPAKELRVAHLNVCSLRNKMDELRCSQLLCKFDMIAITETHLDKTVPDSALDINRMKLLRLHRKGRKGGGCALYFAEHLHGKICILIALKESGYTSNFRVPRLCSQSCTGLLTQIIFSILSTPF